MHFSHTFSIRSRRTVSSITFRAPNFPIFSLGDLERLKDTDQWLSDTHLAFSLMCVSFLLCLASILRQHRDSFREFGQRNTWGNLKIQLLDTSFWPLVTDYPERFTEGYRARVNLLEHDFVVMPMFERCSNSVTRDHWKLGIIEKPGKFMHGNT